ncbi:helix-turn-helix domain-containing protein [Nocardia sp. NRRL S-836]|uniref:helix-turn-helix domain-containing protein n=1 Tax=Nocardia sp. NRRL S-836 TaxID=1519492 RepID=UPI0012F944FA|nr:helix-turn-helix domain-containing protein [Nocardia sp. NRRL S-836]
MGQIRGLPDSRFYHRPELRAHLAERDFGAVFRAIRDFDHPHGGLTQDDLAEILEMSQPKVSAIESGHRPLKRADDLVRVVNTLGIAPYLVGIGTEPSPAGEEDAEVGSMDRRSFLAAAPAIVAGLSLGDAPGTPPAAVAAAAAGDVGPDDVLAVQRATRYYRSQAYRFGGARSRAAATVQVRQSLAQAHEATGPHAHALRLAVADLAGTTAWMHYDVEQHGPARALWRDALQCAEGVEDPRSADLVVTVLLDGAHQALHLDKPKDALYLVQLAAAQATTHRYPVSPGTRAYIDMIMAWCHASLGHRDAMLRALDKGVQTYTDLDPAAAPPWASHLGPAEIHAQHGHALHLLATSTAADTTAAATAAEAAEHLAAAVDTYGTDYSRSAAVNLPGLSANRFRVGDIEGAVDAGLSAVDAIAELRIPRAHKRLRQLHTQAAAHADRADVAELRHRIDRVLKTSAA